MAHSKCMDESLLTCSMQTGVTGVRLILQTVAEGTAEVKSILLHEVNILFECKICDNIFRGFPNLLTHKRVYCRESVLTKSGDELIPGGIADDETGDRDKSSSGLMKDLDTDIADWNSANAENRPATKVTLNLLKRLAKRWMNSDESVPSFGSGFQGVRRKPPSGVLGGNKNVAQDAKKDDSAYTLVLPEDPVNRLHSMELRLRRSANASKFVKTVSRDELSIITRLEGCKTCDLMTRTCLVERCKRSFPDIETLAYHMNYSHADTRPSGPLSCLLCGKQLGGFRALRAHIQLSHRRVAMHYNDEVMKRWPEKPKEYSGNYRHIKRPNPNVVFVKEVPPLSNDVPVFPESPKQSSALDDSQVLVEKKQKGDISISKPPTLQVTDPIKSQVAADGLASGGANMVVTSSTNPGAAVTERRIVTLHTGGKNEQSILLFNKSRNVLLQLKPSAMGSKDRQHGKQNYVALLPKKYIVSAEAKISTAQRSVSRVQMKPSLPEILPLSEPTEVTSASEFSLPVLTSSDIEKAMSALYVGFLNNNAYNDVSVPTVPDVAQTVEIKVRRGPGRPRRLRLQSDGSDDHLKNPSLNPKLLCNRKRSKFPGNKMARGMLNRGIRWNPRRKVMLQRTKAGSQVQLNMESDFYMDEKSLKLNFAPATKALPQLRIRRTLKSPYNSEEYVNTWPGSREERMEKTAFRDRTSFHGSGWKGDIAGTSDSRSMHHRLPSRKARAVSKGAGSDECDYKFPVMFTAIQEQQLEEVADLDAFLCRRCGSQFTTRSNTERHCYAHLSFVRFRCRLCNTAAFYLSDMKRHLVKQCTKISSRKIGAKQFKENILPCNENQPGRVMCWKGFPVVWSRSLKPRATKKTMMLAQSRSRSMTATDERSLVPEISNCSKRVKRECTVWENGALNECDYSEPQSSPVAASSSDSQQSFAVERSSAPSSNCETHSTGAVSSSCPVHGMLSAEHKVLREVLMSSALRLPAVSVTFEKRQEDCELVMAPTLPPTDDRNEKPTSPVGGRNAAPTGDVTLRKCLEQDNSPSDSTVRVIHTAAVVSLTKRSGNTSSSSGPNDLAGSKH